jgi:hypothetical protein
MVHLYARTLRRFLGMLAFVAVVGLLAAPASLGGPTQTAPPPTLPPPAVTIQQVVNELLPLIRQLDPITQQVGPLLGQLDPLFEAGGEFSAQFKVVGAQLEPVLAPAGLAMAALGEALEPLFASLDEQVAPPLQDLLAMLGPYINQVDLATAFQVIGPLAPTAVKAIPTLNTFYDGIDSITGQLLNPVSCPLARAVPQQKLLNVVVPFLCYDTLASVGPIGGAPPADPVVPGGPSDPVASPDVGADAVSPAPPGATLDVGPIGLPPLGSLPAARTPARTGSSSAVIPDTIQQITSGDDRVDALETRLRLMMILGAGLGVLLSSFFRPVPSDEGAGLGAFRKPRTGPAPSLQ